MGIRKKEVYIVVCDNCPTELENGEGGTLCLNNKSDAKKHIEFSGWKKKDGKIFCENCYVNSA